MFQMNPAVMRTGNRPYMLWYVPPVRQYPLLKTKVEDLNTLPTVQDKTETKFKRRYILIAVLSLIGILTTAIGVPFVVGKIIISATTDANNIPSTTNTTVIVISTTTTSETTTTTSTSTTSTITSATSTSTTSTITSATSTSTTSTTSSTTTTTIICENDGIPLWNGTCACNNYTTGTYCQTPQCLVAGFFSTTCSNNGTCIYNTSTQTSTCSCSSNSWTGNYCQTPVCPQCNNNCGNGYCNSPSSCYCNSGYQGTCCNSSITSGECLSLSPMNTTSWGNGFNNTYYGREHDIVNVSCTLGKSITVAACFYGINNATPGCGGTTTSATCQSMDVSAGCKQFCSSSLCSFQIENTLFNDTCYGKLKQFWMYFTCS